MFLGFFFVFIVKNGKFVFNIILIFLYMIVVFFFLDGYDMVDLYFYWRSGYYFVYGI